MRSLRDEVPYKGDRRSHARQAKGVYHRDQVHRLQYMHEGLSRERGLRRVKEETYDRPDQVYRLWNMYLEMSGTGNRWNI